MKTGRSRTQLRLEFVQNVVIILFALTGWAMCLAAYAWSSGETPDAQFNGKVGTVILGAVFFLIALWEVWKTSPIHLHIVWHRHYFVEQDEQYVLEPPPDPEKGRRWMQESGLMEPDPAPSDPPPPAWLDPNAQPEVPAKA